MSLLTQWYFVPEWNTAKAHDCTACFNSKREKARSWTRSRTEHGSYWMNSTLRAHYSDYKMIPIKVLCNGIWYPNSWSLHMIRIIPLIQIRPHTVVILLRRKFNVKIRQKYKIAGAGMATSAKLQSPKCARGVVNIFLLLLTKYPRHHGLYGKLPIDPQSYSAASLWIDPATSILAKVENCPGKSANFRSFATFNSKVFCWKRKSTG